jgi:hypothetical protein
MSVVADYTVDEQKLLMEGPRLGALVVSASSLGKSTETVSEGFAAADYVLNSREAYLGNTLVGSIQFALEGRAESGDPFASYVDLAEAPDALSNALARLRELAALLDRDPDAAEAAGYKDWVMNAAAAASAAGKEGGGFLGWGSVMVNDAEKAALDEVAAALGVQS